LPQTAEALATVDNSVRSVATRAECATTFANFFIEMLRFSVKASVEGVNVFSMLHASVDEVCSCVIRIFVSF
jgi:hypothetical protein